MWEHAGEPRLHRFPASLDGEDAGHLKGNRSVSSGCGQGHAASATSVPGIWCGALSVLGGPEVVNIVE